MRRTPALILAGVAMIGTSVASGESAVAAEPESTSKSVPPPGKVRYYIATWTVTGGKHETTVRVGYPSGDPRTDWDHQPVRIQVRVKGGNWQTVGEAKQ